MCGRHTDKQTLAAIVHTISNIKKIATGGQSGIFLPFDVKKQNSTLAAYGITNVFPHKKYTV